MTLPRLIAVVRSENESECRTIVRGLLAAQIFGIEITMTVPGAVGLISEFANGGGIVGAGTVLDAATAELCCAAGARFVVSPVTDEDVWSVARHAGVPYVGGALTPSEIARAMRLPSDAVKIFPIGAAGGVRYLKAVREPFPSLRAVVSGGVAPDDVAGYLAAGAVSVCMGGALIDRAAAARGDVSAVAAKAAAVRQRIEEDERA